MGIKPGSEEFHVSKNGHDLCDDKDSGGGDQRGKRNGKNKGKKQN